MNTQTHIVYRNRAEHDFWESGMIVPLGGALGAGFLVFLFLAWAYQKVTRNWRGPSNTVMTSMIVIAGGIGILTFNLLMF